MKKLIPSILIFVIFGLSIFVLAMPGDKDYSKMIRKMPTTETICKDGLCTKTIYGGEMNYHNGTNFIQVNTTLTNSSRQNYEYEMTKASYQAYFKNNLNTGEAVRFEKDGYYFIYDLSGGKIQWVEQEGDTTKTKSIGAMLSSNGMRNNNKIQYNNAFAYTNISYTLENEMLKEYFILSQLPPDSTDYFYLEYTGEIKFSSELTIFAEGENKTGKDFQTRGRIEFRDQSGKSIFHLPEPTIIGSNYTEGIGYYNIKVSETKIQFGLRVNASLLEYEKLVYPVYIDPTIQVSGAGTGILEDTFVFVYESPFTTNRSTILMKFNISSIPSDRIITDARLGMYSDDTYNIIWADTEKVNISRINNQTWVETDSPVSLWNLPTTNESQHLDKWSNGTNVSGDWDYLDVLDMIKTDYALGNSNASFRIETETGHDTPDTSWSLASTLYFGDASLTNGIGLRSKEYLVVANRPYLNITYTYLLDVAIDHPKTQSYNTNESLSLNYTIINTTVLDTCWYHILNSTGDSEVANTTIASCLNTTFNVSNSDTYTIYLYVNETGGIEDSDVITFSVSLVAPSIVLDAPSNNSYFKNGTDIYFNFTATDTDGLDTCSLWHNNTGTWHNNFTWVGPTSGVQNFTYFNITEDVKFKWNVLCNDTLNNVDWALNNLTITTDTIIPLVEITTDNDTTIEGVLVTVNYNITDTNIDTCYFTLKNSTGSLHNYAENTSMSCSANSKTISVVSYDTFTFQLWGEDKLGYLNNSEFTFTTIPTVPTNGGGGTTEVIVEVIVPDNRTFCGDGICQFDGNDLGIREDWFNCNQDCEPFDFDAFIHSFTIHCFDGDPSTTCFFSILFGTVPIGDPALEEFAVCGNQICEITESPWSCPEDCGRINIDTLVTGCFDDDEFTPCFWSTNTAYLILFSFGGLIFALSFAKIRLPGIRKKTTPYSYVRLNIKKRKKRWRR